MMNSCVIKAFKKTGQMVGVMFIASAFHVASAQQYSDNAASQNANIVLQIQTLQAEIADLRDMIERQNYQIRLLKKQLNSTTTQVTSPSTSASVPNTIVASTVSAESATEGGTEISSGQAEGLANNQTSTGGIVAPPAINPQGQDAAVNNATINADPTNPNLGNSAYVDPVNANGVADGTVTGVEVEDRNLDPRDTVYSANDFPPVTEVEVGKQSTVQPQLDAANTAQTESVIFESTDVFEASTPQNTNLPTQEPIVEPTAPIVPLPSQAQVNEQPQQVVVSQPSAINTTTSTDTTNNAISNSTNDIQPVETTLPASTAASPASDVVSTPEQVLPAASSQNALPQLPPELVLSEQEYYQEGFELLKQSNHSGAVDVFKKQINAYPDGDLADDAYYWIAESMYVNRRLNVSKENFKIIIDRYQSSPRLPDAMLKVAYIDQEQGNKMEARLLLQEIVQQHPSSNAAISAKNRLEQLN